MGSKNIFKIFLFLFILVFIYSCDGEYEGFYKTTYHMETERLCDNNIVKKSKPKDNFKFFTLDYSSFSLSTYILKGCSDEKKENCETLYYFDPNNIESSGGEVIINENRECGIKVQTIKGILVTEK